MVPNGAPMLRLWSQGSTAEVTSHKLDRVDFWRAVSLRSLQRPASIETEHPVRPRVPPRALRYGIAQPSLKRTDHLLSGAVRSCPYARRVGALTAGRVLSQSVRARRERTSCASRRCDSRSGHNPPDLVEEGFEG